MIIIHKNSDKIERLAGAFPLMINNHTDNNEQGIDQDLKKNLYFSLIKDFSQNYFNVLLNVSSNVYLEVTELKI